MKRHLRLAGLVASVAIIAAACSTGGASTAPSAAGSAAPSVAPSAAASGGASAAPSAGGELAFQGEITFWNTQRDIENVELQKQVTAWQDLHPGITVKTDLVPFDGADKKYTDAANAGSQPDIMRADIGWTPTFADAGMLLDLTKYFPADFQKQFLPAPMGTAIYKSGMYGVPQVTDALGLQCNKTLLTAAGLTAAPTSWDELVTAGQKVTDLAAKKYGFYMNGDSYWSQSFIWGWGGTLFTVNDRARSRDRRQLARVRRWLDISRTTSWARSLRPPGTSRPTTTT
jgi:arabinogalactan oligomer/maltooligosaccharide transport system substrate-binding protein